jgi:hypothetical protein
MSMSMPRVSNFRHLAAELEEAHQHRDRGPSLPDQDARVAAPAVIGAVLEGLVGPSAPSGGTTREAVQMVTLFALRALGVVDARARGLVAQCALP